MLALMTKRTLHVDGVGPGIVLQLCCLAASGQSANQEPAPASANPPWQYGALVNLGYACEFNHPANHLFRNRGTTPRVDKPELNMVALYVRKDASPVSRWGAEFEVQTGEDSKTFGFSATAPNLEGADALGR